MVTGYTAGNSIRLTLLGDTEYVSLSAFLDAAGDIKDILRALGLPYPRMRDRALNGPLSAPIRVACILRLRA